MYGLKIIIFFFFQRQKNRFQTIWPINDPIPKQEIDIATANFYFYLSIKEDTIPRTIETKMMKSSIKNQIFSW